MPSFDLQATDVTGTHSILARDVQRTLSAGDVARSLAAVMLLPDNVPWSLRDEGSSAFLDDDRPIGEQVEPGAKVTITPKAHLG